MFHYRTTNKLNKHVYNLKKKKKKKKRKKKEKPTYRPSFFSTRYRKQTYNFFWPKVQFTTKQTTIQSTLHTKYKVQFCYKLRTTVSNKYT